jgi:hypothetical protein
MDCKSSIEEVVNMLALFTSIESACEALNPAQATAYKEGFAKMLQKEKASDSTAMEMIESARQHPQFAERVKQTDAYIAKEKPDDLMRDCNALLIHAKEKTTTSPTLEK